MGTPHPFEDLDAPSLDARERHHSTGANAETHIFLSMRSLAEGHRMQAREIEKLRERLGTSTMLIDVALKALDQGMLRKVRDYLELAEKASRGEK